MTGVNFSFQTVDLAGAGAQIKIAYESQANTNAFTNTDFAKLNALPTNAELQSDYAQTSGATFTGNIVVPDATADGQALAYGQQQVIFSGNSPAVSLYETDGTADARIFKMVRGGFDTLFRTVEDDNLTAVRTWLRLDESSGTADFTGSAAVTVPDANADGEAVNKGQLDALADQLAPRPDSDGTVDQVLAIESLSPLATKWVTGGSGGGGAVDTANVTAAGALMDSEVTNLAAVKAFDPGAFATAAQGTLADNAFPKKAAATISGTTHTAVTGDADRTNICTNADAVDVTIPTGLAVGWRALFASAGAGGLSLTTTGNTLLGSSPSVGVAQNEGIYVEVTASDTLLVLGGTA